MGQSSALSITKEASEVLFRNILAAYDFSEASETAFQHAMAFARIFRGFVTVVSVQTSADLAAEMKSGFERTESHRQLSDDLQRVARKLTEQGIQNRVAHRAGAVADVLVQMAAESKADLLLLGAYGQKRIGHPGLGSTAESMLRSMPCAVLTVGPEAVLRGRAVPPMRTLLLASSLPAKAGRGEQFVTTLAKKTGARVKILHVIDYEAKVRDIRRPEEMKEAEEAFAGRLRQAGVDATWELTSGAQDRRVVERSEEIHADLVVFGLEHLPGHPDAMGTISTAIWEAPCPVLTIPGRA